MMQSANINQPAGQVMVAATPQSTMNVKAFHYLGIVQIVFGVLAIAFGIGGAAGTSGMWVSSSGNGIWFGVWILVTGIIGFFSARQPQNRCLIGTNMGFNIACTVISLCNFIFCAIAIRIFSKCMLRIVTRRTRVVYGIEYDYFYPNVRAKLCQRNAGIAIYSILMILTVAEFAISLAISIFCFKSICCRNECNGSCCQTSEGTTQPPAVYQFATTNATGETVMVTNTGYPQGLYASYLVQGKAFSKPGVVLQPGMIQQRYPQQQGMPMTPQPVMVQQGYPQQHAMPMTPQPVMVQQGYLQQQGMTTQPWTIQKGYPAQQPTQYNLQPHFYSRAFSDQGSEASRTCENTNDLNAEIGEKNLTNQNTTDN